ncbi:MAG: cytochrome c biogenesis CcdA family protein [Pseudomonadota bacterium]
MIEILLAIMAGMLTIAAPCILPMLPILLGASVGQTDRSRPVFIALGFVLTFSAFALLFGLVPDLLGLSPDVLRDTATAMLLGFGLLMIWPSLFQRLTMRMNGLLNAANALGERGGAGKFGGFVLGMTLGVVWTPCAGPVLGSILTLVATAQEPGRASLLLLCYSFGAGIPMLAIAYGGQFMSTRVRQVARYSHGIQQGFGVLVCLTALAIFFQYDILLASWLSSAFTQFQTGA